LIITEVRLLDRHSSEARRWAVIRLASFAGGRLRSGLGIERLERERRLEQEEVVRVMIDVFISPTSSWHPPYTPPKPPEPPPGLDRPALALFNALLRHGRYGSLIWPLLNEVAAEQQPIDRAEARRMRLELWWQLRKLMKVGLVFRYTRKSVSVYNLK
jgi:hypothetical protein